MVGLAFTMGKPHPYRCHIIKMINSCCVHNGERFWCDFSGPVVGGVPCGKGDGSKDGGTSGFRYITLSGTCPQSIKWHKLATMPWLTPYSPWESDCPRLHHQPAVLLDAPAHFLRLSSDQQISCFASRGKLVLKAWEATSLAKIPLEKVVAEPAREGALDQQLPKREVCNRQEVDIIYHKKSIYIYI